jgi:hypothetical protein
VKSRGGTGQVALLPERKLGRLCLEPSQTPSSPTGSTAPTPLACIKTVIGQHTLDTSQTNKSNSEIMSRDSADNLPGNSSPVTPAFTKALPKIEVCLLHQCLLFNSPQFNRSIHKFPEVITESCICFHNVSITSPLLISHLLKTCGPADLSDKRLMAVFHKSHRLKFITLRLFTAFNIFS